MITIDLIQESIDVTGYQNVLANSVAVPFVIVLALVMTVVTVYAHDALASRSRSRKEYYEPGDVASGCITVFFTLATGLTLALIPMIFLGVKIGDTPRGDNSFFDRISYVAYYTDLYESKHKTLKEDFHDDIKDAIDDKKDDLEKYGLDDDACESHKRSTTEVSVLGRGDAIKDVNTMSHNIHIAIGNTTEISKDNMPRNHIDVKGGEELFWAALVINRNE